MLTQSQGRCYQNDILRNQIVITEKSFRRGWTPRTIPHSVRYCLYTHGGLSPNNRGGGGKNNASGRERGKRGEVVRGGGQVVESARTSRAYYV